MAFAQLTTVPVSLQLEIIRGFEFALEYRADKNISGTTYYAEIRATDAKDSALIYTLWKNLIDDEKGIVQFRVKQDMTLTFTKTLIAGYLMIYENGPDTDYVDVLLYRGPVAVREAGQVI